MGGKKNIEIVLLIILLSIAVLWTVTIERCIAKKMPLHCSQMVMSASIIVCAYAICRLKPRVSLRKYTKACLYIAVMDDEIVRNELEGNKTGGIEIIFPDKRESLQYRYHMHLNLHKKCSEDELEDEIRKYEIRLYESKQYYCTSNQ